ncbi:diguanylate cyclase domain-containing protein, partial [Nocardia wallacei]|uniref:diguanylate cyclase domain-containing protein n=1 Tax=Nocardia wallacei TaxID=480035 RepID=UPI002453F859
GPPPPPPPWGCLFLHRPEYTPHTPPPAPPGGSGVWRGAPPRLRAAAAPDGLAARLGGDEFIVLRERCADTEQLVSLSGRLLAALAEPIVVAGQSISVGASVGTALVTQHPEAIDDLMHTVDTAMYRNKAARHRPGSRSRQHQ